MTKVQGRVYKDEWASCACSLILEYEEAARYECAECGGSGKVERDDILEDAAYQRARQTGRWKKRCGHCNGAGWHP